MLATETSPNKPRKSQVVKVYHSILYHTMHKQELHTTCFPEKATEEHPSEYFCVTVAARCNIVCAANGNLYVHQLTSASIYNCKWA
jgi:hypothetical protein